MASKLEEDLCCAFCRDIFKDPVTLSCCHSFCKECVQKCWKEKDKECPLCKKRQSSKLLPPIFALKNVSETFLQERGEKEDICSEHGEKLKIFCLDHEEPVCVICKDSVKHANHRFRPINEAAEEHKKKLQDILPPLKEKLEVCEKVKAKLDHILRHIKVQAQHTEAQIKEQFKKLHQFLVEEEEAWLSALEEEEKQKSRRMREEMEALSREIAALSQTLRDTEDQLPAEDISHLKIYQAAMERVQQRSLLEHPQLHKGALIDQAKHLGNLGFNIWNKMKDVISYTPVILDPNIAGSGLVLSDDLTAVRRGEEQLPDNPERFDVCECSVLGSKGFDSGTHSWVIQVGDNTNWDLGVSAESVPRKGGMQSGLMSLWLEDGRYRAFSPLTKPVLPLMKQPKRIRVNLDCDGGKLSFYDLDSNTVIHTLTHTFTERMYPYITTWDKASLKILPEKITVSVEQK